MTTVVGKSSTSALNLRAMNRLVVDRSCDGGYLTTLLLRVLTNGQSGFAWSLRLLQRVRYPYERLDPVKEIQSAVIQRA